LLPKPKVGPALNLLQSQTWNQNNTNFFSAVYFFDKNIYLLRLRVVDGRQDFISMVLKAHNIAIKKEELVSRSSLFTNQKLKSTSTEGKANNPSSRATLRPAQNFSYFCIVLMTCLDNKFFLQFKNKRIKYKIECL